MITIEVDEAYAFDFLSILEVKASVNFANKSAYDTYIECKDHIQKQIGEKLEEVLQSKEYLNMLKVNKDLFTLIDTIRAGSQIDAKAVDDANMERFRLKRELQKKFFSSDVKEWKSST